MSKWDEQDDLTSAFYDRAEILRTINRVAVERDPDSPITHMQPHYTDDRFREPQTVYLATGYNVDKQQRYPTVEGATYNYSDRIWQWDRNKADAANKASLEKGFHRDSAARFEVYLRLYFDKPTLKLVHVMAGFNVATGYPYQVFGYIDEA